MVILVHFYFKKLGGSVSAGALKNTQRIRTQCGCGWALKNSGCQCTLIKRNSKMLQKTRKWDQSCVNLTYCGWHGWTDKQLNWEPSCSLCWDQLQVQSNTFPPHHTPVFVSPSPLSSYAFCIDFVHGQMTVKMAVTILSFKGWKNTVENGKP